MISVFLANLFSFLCLTFEPACPALAPAPNPTQTPPVDADASLPMRLALEQGLRPICIMPAAIFARIGRKSQRCALNATAHRVIVEMLVALFFNFFIVFGVLFRAQC